MTVPDANVPKSCDVVRSVVVAIVPVILGNVIVGEVPSVIFYGACNFTKALPFVVSS